MGTNVHSRKKGDLTKMSHNKKTLTDSLTDTDLSEIIQMALSDHITFSEIEIQYGLREDQVKKIMRKNIKPSSYRTWRKRVKSFSERRQYYK